MLLEYAVTRAGAREGQGPPGGAASSIQASGLAAPTRPPSLEGSALLRAAASPPSHTVLDTKKGAKCFKCRSLLRQATWPGL